MVYKGRNISRETSHKQTSKQQPLIGSRYVALLPFTEPVGHADGFRTSQAHQSVPETRPVAEVRPLRLYIQ
jgi:hypothetical protein